MDELTLNRAFVKIVESGSMSAAARHLKISVTSVARQLSRLEDRLGVRLLNRTTRRQSLTEVGQLYYARLVDVLNQFNSIQREASAYQATIKGCLRVHLRISVGSEVIVPALPSFLEQHPDVTLDVTLTDERADLVALGVDVAVWLGNLEDSTLVARQLSPGRRVICASPAYLARHGRPKAPQDLSEHNCIFYRARNYDRWWRLTRDGETIAVLTSGNLQTDSSSVLLTSARKGLGLVLVQESTVRRAITKGELVRVLADYEVSSTDFDIALYAVYPNSRHVSPKTRAFVDFLVTLFRQDTLHTAGERRARLPITAAAKSSPVPKPF
jgi:DNA-binding transcriptional LysR family regulator